MSQGSMEFQRHNPADAGARVCSSLRPARSAAKSPVSLASIPRSARGRRDKDRMLGFRVLSLVIPQKSGNPVFWFYRY